MKLVIKLISFVSLVVGLNCQNCCTSSTYTVVSGDTLNAIAGRYNTNLAAIQTCNPSITNTNLISVGEVITIPSASCSSSGTGTPINPLATGNCGQGYTAFVAPSATTLLQVAQMFCPNPSSSYQAGIAAYNNIGNTNSISANQVVCVPNNCNTGATGTPSSVSCPSGYTQVSPPANSNLTTVVSAYCSSASPNFSTYLTGVAEFNGLVNSYSSFLFNPQSVTTYSGQVLCLPPCNSVTGTGNQCNPGSAPYTVQGSTTTVSQIASQFCSNPSQNYIAGIITANFGQSTTVNANTALASSTQLCVPINCNTASNGYGVNCPAGSVSFIFQSGNTLNNIASQYCVNPTTGYMNSILAMNGNSQTNPLHVGEYMCIPTNCQTGSSTSSGTSCQYTYTVQAGDTLNSIASNCGISASAIQTTNPSIGCSSTTVTPGQVICIPSCNNPTSNYVYNNVAVTPVSNPNINTNNVNTGCTAYYMIKAGDTCASLATYYPSFTNANPNINCANLVPGESVCINGTLANAPNPCDATYTTKSGDTCASLAASYPMFYTLNPTINCCTGITAGQYICLSQTKYNCNNSANTGSNTLNNCNAFATANGISTANLLYCNPGQSLCNNYLPTNVNLVV
jgi:LysM repeat protein